MTSNDTASESTGAEARRALTAEALLRRGSTCSIDEAASILNIARSTAYAAARDGSLPTLRVAGRILVPTAKLLAMLGLEETKE